MATDALLNGKRISDLSNAQSSLSSQDLFIVFDNEGTEGHQTKNVSLEQIQDQLLKEKSVLQDIALNIDEEEETLEIDYEGVIQPISSSSSSQPVQVSEIKLKIGENQTPVPIKSIKGNAINYNEEDNSLTINDNDTDSRISAKINTETTKANIAGIVAGENVTLSHNEDNNFVTISSTATIDPSLNVKIYKVTKTEEEENSITTINFTSDELEALDVSNNQQYCVIIDFGEDWPEDGPNPTIIKKSITFGGETGFDKDAIVRCGVFLYDGQSFDLLSADGFHKGLIETIENGGTDANGKKYMKIKTFGNSTVTVLKDYTLPDTVVQTTGDKIPDSLLPENVVQTDSTGYIPQNLIRSGTLFSYYTISGSPQVDDEDSTNGTFIFSEASEGGGSTPSGGGSGAAVLKGTCTTGSDFSIKEISGLSSNVNLSNKFLIVTFTNGWTSKSNRDSSFEGDPYQLQINNVNYSIYYNGNTNPPSGIVGDMDTVLFYCDGTSFYLLSVAETAEKGIEIVEDEDTGVVTIMTKGKTYNIATDEVSNKLDNIVTSFYRGDTNLISLTENDNSLTVDLNLDQPEGYDLDQIPKFLRGDGQWSEIDSSTIFSEIFDYINDQFLPVGSYYYTSDPSFHPGDLGEGAGGAHWWSTNQQAAYNNLQWELVPSRTDTNSNPPIYCWHKTGTLNIG